MLRAVAVLTLMCDHLFKNTKKRAHIRQLTYIKMRCITDSLQVDYMEPIVEKITLVEDARFDSPKSMFLGRVMG